MLGQSSSKTFTGPLEILLIVSCALFGVLQFYKLPNNEKNKEEDKQFNFECKNSNKYIHFYFTVKVKLGCHYHAFLFWQYKIKSSNNKFRKHKAFCGDHIINYKSHINYYINLQKENNNNLNVGKIDSMLFCVIELSRTKTFCSLASCQLRLGKNNYLIRQRLHFHQLNIFNNDE